VRGNTRIQRLSALHDRGQRPPSVNYFMSKKMRPRWVKDGGGYLDDRGLTFPRRDWIKKSSGG
jgi:hypothetical protein